MSDELKPCPFCGADHLPFGWFPHTNKVTVACATVGCFVRELTFCTEADALAAWNRRHSPAPADADVYKPTVVIFKDRAEFVTRDCATIYREIERGAAEILDMETREPIGMRVELPAVKTAAPADAGLVATLTRDAAQLRCEHVNEHIAEDLEKAAAAITRLEAENARLSTELAEARAGLLASERHCDILTGDLAVLAEAADCAETECDDQCARRVEIMRELNETRARLAAAEARERGRCLDIALNHKLIAYTRWSDRKHRDAAQITAGEIYDAIRALPAEKPGEPETEARS